MYVPQDETGVAASASVVSVSVSSSSSSPLSPPKPLPMTRQCKSHGVTKCDADPDHLFRVRCSRCDYVRDFDPSGSGAAKYLYYRRRTRAARGLLSVGAPLDGPSASYLCQAAAECGIVSNTSQPHVTFVEGLVPDVDHTASIGRLRSALFADPKLTVVSVHRVPRRDNATDLILADVILSPGADLAATELSDGRVCHLPQFPFHVALGACPKARGGSKWAAARAEGRLKGVALAFDATRVRVLPPPEGSKKLLQQHPGHHHHHQGPQPHQQHQSPHSKPHHGHGHGHHGRTHPPPQGHGQQGSRPSPPRQHQARSSPHGHHHVTHPHGHGHGHHNDHHAAAHGHGHPHSPPHVHYHGGHHQPHQPPHQPHHQYHPHQHQPHPHLQQREYYPASTPPRQHPHKHYQHQQQWSGGHPSPVPPPHHQGAPQAHSPATPLRNQHRQQATQHHQQAHQQRSLEKRMQSLCVSPAPSFGAYSAGGGGGGGASSSPSSSVVGTDDAASTSGSSSTSDEVASGGPSAPKEAVVQEELNFSGLAVDLAFLDDTPAGASATNLGLEGPQKTAAVNEAAPAGSAPVQHLPASIWAQA